MIDWIFKLVWFLAAFAAGSVMIYLETENPYVVGLVAMGGGYLATVLMSKIWLYSINRD